MFNIWYNFFISNFFNGVAPTTQWQILTLEIASVCMCFLVVIGAIVMLSALFNAIIKMFDRW